MASGAVSTRRARPALWVGWLGLGLAILLCAIAATYALGPLARERGWLVDGGNSTVPAEVIAALHPEPERLGAGVIDPAQADSPETSEGERIRQAMAATPPELPGRYGGAVANLDGGVLEYDLAAHEGFIPASTMKVMLAVAVLDALGPATRFTTTVVAPAPGQIVLVGGGDPLLASTATSYPWSATVTLPTTAELAARTVEKLRAQGVSEVSLGYDDSLFTGDVWHPDWPAVDRAYVAPVSALVVDEAATSPGVGSASAAAAAIFADQLRAAGVNVVGEPVAASGAGASQVAAIESIPVSLLVQELLVHSDNFVAEMLLRQLALHRGEPASFDGGAAALTAQLRDLGLWSDAQRIADGSGLSSNNRLAPAALVAAMQLAAERDDLSDVLAGMPVGCATGTLTNRFTDPRATPARGQVRAKTGTLDKVSALAGYTPTVDGGLLAFAFIGNDLPTDRDVRAWFDLAGAALAGCDCVA